MATWNFDAAHTSASFSAKHLMVTTVRGHFAAPTGTLEFDPENQAASKVAGDLTIHGVTRPVTLNVEYLGMVNSPFGDKRVGFTATGKINREDWGLTWNVAIEAGGVLVGKDIKLELDLEAILVPEAETTAAANA
jgi:polyisoprenoid-binding protein YceI